MIYFLLGFIAALLSVRLLFRLAFGGEQELYPPDEM